MKTIVNFQWNTRVLAFFPLAITWRLVQVAEDTAGQTVNWEGLSVKLFLHPNLNGG